MCPRKPDHEEINLLQELQHLQARESAPDIEPPALIDQAVRNMARRELNHQSKPVAGKLRWIAGLSTASIALIALGISMVQTPSAPGPVPESFENRKIELRSRGEASEIASPSEVQLSRSAQAPEAAAVSEEPYRQSADSAKETANAESALADESDHSNLALEASESVDSDAMESRKESAQAWLDSIEQLHEQGLHTEAVEELRAWQQQYPDVALPDWASGLLPFPSPD